MDFNQYQKQASKTALMIGQENEIYYLALGLCGESGEIAEKIKKILRDKGGDFSKLNKEDFAKELGDTLWYISMIARYFNIPFENVAKGNIDKLTSRKNRNCLNGSGDNR